MQEQMYECSRENAKPKQLLKSKKVVNNSNHNITGSILASVPNNKRNKKDEINVDNLDFTKKILHTSWHPKENIIAIAATNNLYIFNSKECGTNAYDISVSSAGEPIGSFQSASTFSTS